MLYIHFICVQHVKLDNLRGDVKFYSLKLGQKWVKGHWVQDIGSIPQFRPCILFMSHYIYETDYWLLRRDYGLQFVITFIVIGICRQKCWTIFVEIFAWKITIFIRVAFLNKHFSRFYEIFQIQTWQKTWPLCLQYTPKKTRQIHDH